MAFVRFYIATADAHQPIEGVGGAEPKLSTSWCLGRLFRDDKGQVVWDQANLGVDLETEREQLSRQILPALGMVTLAKIEDALGCSRRHATMMRRGDYIPHLKHYAALVALVEAAPFSWTSTG
jgi:hypothetical protein